MCATSPNRAKQDKRSPRASRRVRIGVASSVTSNNTLTQFQEGREAHAAEQCTGSHALH